MTPNCVRFGSFLGRNRKAQRRRRALVVRRALASRPRLPRTAPEISIYTRFAAFEVPETVVHGVEVTGPCGRYAASQARCVQSHQGLLPLAFRSGTSPWWDWTQARLCLGLALKLVLDGAISNKESRGGAAALRPPSLDALEMKWPRRREMHRSSPVAV